MRTAVVVGAGLAGLAAAGGLARDGWHVTVLEGRERVAAPPTALVLWPNGRRALESLDPDGGWPAIAAPLPDGGVRRPDGQWLVPPHTRPGAGPAPAVVPLQDLYDALVAGLGERVEIRTGFAVTTVRARRASRPAVGDGRVFLEADLIVAADGIDSTIRRALAPEAVAVGSGFAAWQAVVPGFRLPDFAPAQAAGGETLGAGYRFVAIPLGRGGFSWVATAAGAPRPEPPATQLALLRRWFSGWHAPVGELLAATHPEDLVPQEVRELRPLPRAYGFRCGPGGVVLLGDAAHAMPHHLGQGACLAFEDAATLRSLVATAEPGAALGDAVEEYDRTRRPRAATVVRQTRRMSAVVQARGRLALRARDAALGSLRPRILGSAHGLAADWQPPDRP
ncbi:FAD-dependent oxidoreductase [Symbioplanes lichenis]|uniref:FAD-dependent oxidoreductase n=1 Tax=Symbioplanes lichenis TaxID=1629072 RepID=UPI00273A4A5B|nr:NAD(P)/FAD-dependent oxidoreductase [Actinoplanes lichenis]